MLDGSFVRQPWPRHVREDMIRREWRNLERASVRLADLLEQAFRMQDHRQAGWARFDDWAEREFGIPARQAWTFLHLGQRLRELPKTRSALHWGALGYTKAREFAGLATPENEEEWIAFAKKNTSRALERRVRQVRSGTPDEKEHFSAYYDGLDMQVIEQAWHEAKREIGKTISIAELLPYLARRYLEGKLPASRRRLFGFNVTQTCAFCLNTWVPTRTGNLRVSFDRWVKQLADGEVRNVNLLGEQLCECDGRKHRADACPENPESPIYDPKLDVSRYVPKNVLYTVWLRDGGRCRVPGCTCSGEPENSHIRPVREGGPADARNLVTLCGHHNDLHETGQLEITGQAPYEGYWLDGKFKGVGYEFDLDPEPARETDPRGAEGAAPLSHGGQRPAARAMAPPMRC